MLVISTKVFSVFNFLFFPFVSKAIQYLTMQLCVRCFSKCSLWETQVSTLGTLSIAARVAKVLSEIHTVVSRCVVFDGGRVLLFVSAARYRLPPHHSALLLLGN